MPSAPRAEGSCAAASSRRRAPVPPRRAVPGRSRASAPRRHGLAAPLAPRAVRRTTGRRDAQPRSTTPGNFTGCGTPPGVRRRDRTRVRAEARRVPAEASRGPTAPRAISTRTRCTAPAASVTSIESGKSVRRKSGALLDLEHDASQGGVVAPVRGERREPRSPEPLIEEPAELRACASLDGGHEIVAGWRCRPRARRSSRESPRKNALSPTSDRSMCSVQPPFW